MTRNMVSSFMQFSHFRVALAVLFDGLPVPIYKRLFELRQRGAKVSTTEERRQGERRQGERRQNEDRRKESRDTAERRQEERRKGERRASSS